MLTDMCLCVCVCVSVEGVHDESLAVFTGTDMAYLLRAVATANNAIDTRTPLSPCSINIDMLCCLCMHACCVLCVCSRGCACGRSRHCQGHGRTVAPRAAGGRHSCAGGMLQYLYVLYCKNAISDGGYLSCLCLSVCLQVHAFAASLASRGAALLPSVQAAFSALMTHNPDVFTDALLLSLVCVRLNSYVCNNGVFVCLSVGVL